MDFLRRITKSYPLYESFISVDNWETYPQTISYVCKGAGLQTTQLQPCESRDLVFLQIQTHNIPPFIIINIYNTPIDTIEAREAVQTFTTIPRLLWYSGIIIDNFNLHHPN